MPFSHKCRVLFYGLYIDPFFNLDLGPVLSGALIHLKEVFKIPVLIIPSQGKEPAYGWSVGMDAAAFVLQKGTSSGHIHMGKDEPIQYRKLYLMLHHFRKAFSRTPAEHPYIVRIQGDRLTHVALAAFAAASAVRTVSPDHVIQFIQSSVGNLRQRSFTKHLQYPSFHLYAASGP